MFMFILLTTTWSILNLNYGTLRVGICVSGLKSCSSSPITILESFISAFDNWICGRSGGETVNVTPCKDDEYADDCDIAEVPDIADVVEAIEPPVSTFCTMTPQVGWSSRRGNFPF